MGIFSVKKLIVFFAANFCFAQSVPSSLDWRQSGVILPPPKPSYCGHDTVINGLDAISALSKLHGGALTPLSQQQIYDCSPSWCYCGDAGNIIQVYEMILNSNPNAGGRINTNASYPLRLDGCDKNVCRFSPANVGGFLGSYVQNGQKNAETQLLQFIQLAPVIVTINSNPQSFQKYTGGIYDDASCTADQLNHTLLLVGYGVENGTNFWIARNNWGTGWGESGYIRIVRGKNMCGIGNLFVQPWDT